MHIHKYIYIYVYMIYVYVLRRYNSTPSERKYRFHVLFKKKFGKSKRSYFYANQWDLYNLYFLSRWRKKAGLRLMHGNQKSMSAGFSVILWEPQGVRSEYV